MQSDPREGRIVDEIGKQEKWDQRAGLVQDVFDGMHRDAGEGFWIRVAVMDRVDVGVEGAEVDESVDEVEVKILDDESERKSNDDFEESEEMIRVTMLMMILRRRNSERFRK